MPMLIVDNFEINIIRKKIKNIYLRICCSGQITLTVPNHTKSCTIDSFVQSRLDWLHKNRTVLNNFKQEQTKTNEYKSGEIFYLWGKKYILQIIYDADSHSNNREATEDKSNSILNQPYITHNNYLNLSILSPGSCLTPEYLINKWYKQQLKSAVDLLLLKWQKIIGVEIKSYQIKLMKSRWGSCNYFDSKISLNFQLVKYPLHCLEYVIVHELVHLLEPSHNKRFKSFMTKYLPNWQIYSKDLNTSRYN